MVLPAIEERSSNGGEFVRTLDKEWVGIKYQALALESLLDLCLLVSALRASSCDEVAAEIARIAIDPSRDSEWKQGFMLLNFGSVIQTLKLHSPDSNIDRMLETVCTKTWLQTQLRKSSAGALAATLFRLWSALSNDQLTRFKDEIVAERVRTHVELAATRFDDIESLATAVSLIGVASLFEMSVNSVTLKAICPQEIDVILDRRRYPIECRGISVGEVQLWLGISRLVSTGPFVLRVSRARGEDLLRRWRSTETSIDKYRSLNRFLIAWLEDCAKNGWFLTAATGYQLPDP